MPVPPTSHPSGNSEPSPAADALAHTSGGIVVDVATDGDGEAWDSAMPHLGGGSYYHRFAWRAINQELLGRQSWFLIARRAGRAAGVLPLSFVASRLFGRILCSAPFVNFGGPCAEDTDVSRALVDRAKAIAVELHADCLELRCRSETNVGVAPSLRKISMVVPLTADPEALLASFTPKHRKNLRRAQKNGLEVETGSAELLPEFYAVMERSWRNLGTPFYSRAYFASIFRLLPDASRLFVCRYGGRAIAVAMNGCHEATATVEGLWNGMLPEGRELQANYVLYWQMLDYACRHGYRNFHLGRSTADSGSEDFKSRWSAEKHQLYWYHWSPAGARIPELHVDNPKYRLAIAAWRWLPLPVTRLFGPPLARCIP